MATKLASAWLVASVLLASVLLVPACGTKSLSEGENATDGTESSGHHSSTAHDEGGTPASASDDANDDAMTTYDIGMAADLPPEGCAEEPGEDGDVAFSYIWVANSAQGTISKIDTQALQEKGRYLVRPDGAGSPSRTSVNASGDVAVANRLGGVTKVFANRDACPDLNGDGTITTSSGADDIKPWGSDECVAWHVPFPYTSQRPVAWTQGEWDPSSCDYVEQKLWTAGLGPQGVEVLLLDGDTGVVEETIAIPGFSGASGFGIYGAAVDGDGNFWGAPLGSGSLVFVDRETFEVRLYPTPVSSYGMTVDSDGYVWTCSSAAARFDPLTETWSAAPTGGIGGCMADGKGTLWLGTADFDGTTYANPRLVGVDTRTIQVIDEIVLPKYTHGVSVDFHGYVWGVSLMEPEAYRVDPATKTVETVSGLTGPYTYSDMTGFALKNAGTH